MIYNIILTARFKGNSTRMASVLPTVVQTLQIRIGKEFLK